MLRVFLDIPGRDIRLGTTRDILTQRIACNQCLIELYVSNFEPVSSFKRGGPTAILV